MTRIKWTRQAEIDLVKLCEQAKAPGLNGMLWIRQDKWEAIARQLGRGVRSCQDRYWQRVDRTDKKSYRPRGADVHRVAERSDVPRQQSVSLPHPASLTAFIFGDPLPGRSALDRKLSREARV